VTSEFYSPLSISPITSSDIDLLIQENEIKTEGCITPNTINEEETHWRPLHTAAYEGNEILTKQLLGMGADIFIYNKEGWLPVHLAAMQGHIEIVKIFYEKGQIKNDLTEKNFIMLFPPLFMLSYLLLLLNEFK